MKVFTGRVAALAAMLVLTASAVLGFAGSASADAPYGTSSLGLSVTTTQPCSGGSITVTVTGGKVGDLISVVLHTTPVKTLGTLTVGATKTATGSFTLPSGLTGNVQIVAVDTTGAAAADGSESGSATASANINIVSCAGVDAVAVKAKPTSGIDDLAFTGVAVAAFGVIALALLIGGGALILAGRRASKSAVNPS